MPQPTASQLHVDRYLTDMAIAWAQDSNLFVADKVFPVVPVVKQSDLYAIYEKDYFYRDEMQVRPMGGRPNVAGYEITNGKYFCDEWALEDRIDDRQRANADEPLNPDLASMRMLTQQALIHRDSLWASQYFISGVWGTDWAGTSNGQADGAGGNFLQFDQSGSDPIGFFDQRRVDVLSKTGYAPNTIVLGQDTYRVLKNHSSITDRIKYTQRGIVTTDILAELFDVERVVVPGSVINNAHEGQTLSTDFIVNRKAALMVYAAPAPTINAPSGGYTFAYVGLVPGVTNAFGGVLERGRDELAHSDVIQIRAAYDMEVTASELGEFFGACVA
jgi:hypothetical protein